MVCGEGTMTGDAEDAEKRATISGHKEGGSLAYENFLTNPT
jgi:hypothetical protein